MEKRKLYVLRCGDFEISDGKYTNTVTNLPEVEKEEVFQMLNWWWDRPLVTRLTIKELTQLWQLFKLIHESPYSEAILVFEDLHVELAWNFLKNCMS